MINNSKILLSDFLHHNVRCKDGLDHGSGVMVWMHPPVHRLLGWITKPSSLTLNRDVWRLDQLHGISGDTIYVKGKPAFSDQQTLDRFPTLIDAVLLNNKGNKLGSIVDMVFESDTGNILYYLVSRSNPNIPGSSRWSLTIEQIKDQQPGMVSSDFATINDLPLLKASFRQELLIKTKNWRSQIEDITNRASNKLEGWLEESSFDLDEINKNPSTHYQELNEFDEWIDSEKANNLNQYIKNNNDPWI